MVKQLIGLLAETDTVVRVEGRYRDWRCIECGRELTSPSRPDVCPVCNCTTDDMPPRYHLFFRAEAMEAEAGLVTGFRQFGSGESA